MVAEPQGCNDPFHVYPYWDEEVHVARCGTLCHCGLYVSLGDGRYAMVTKDRSRPHPGGCQCSDCLAWFELMTQRHITGRCPRCSYPLEDHPVQNVHPRSGVTCG